MMNNRSINITPEFIEKFNLSTNPPPPDSLFFQMWNANIGTAEYALSTDFIQGIKNGTLDPIKYGAFNVSDAYYCYNGADDFQTAAQKSADPTLQAFLMKKYTSYVKYNQTFTSIWHLKDASGIVPTPITFEYSAFEQQVALNNHAIYTLITMIPCEYLWYWLANQISPPSSGNLYASWITDNSSPNGSYAMGNFLEQYIQTNQIDLNYAMEIYTIAMTFEYNNFLISTF
jgi:thiaminase (transcriptional activator TenA)